MVGEDHQYRARRVMTEAFLGLSAAERSEALQVAASTSGRPLHVLEKDVWVV